MLYTVKWFIFKYQYLKKKNTDRFRCLIGQSHDFLLSLLIFHRKRHSIRNQHSHSVLVAIILRNGLETKKKNHLEHACGLIQRGYRIRLSIVIFAWDKIAKAFLCPSGFKKFGEWDIGREFDKANSGGSWEVIGAWSKEFDELKDKDSDDWGDWRVPSSLLQLKEKSRRWNLQLDLWRHGRDPSKCTSRPGICQMIWW